MKHILYTLCFSTIILFSCKPFDVALSNELKSANDNYAVKGKNGIMIKQKLSFGNFSTTRVKRSWTRGHAGRTGIGFGTTQSDWINLISTSYIDRKQTVNFNLTDGKQNSDVYCVSRFHSKDFQLGSRENSLLNIVLDISGDGYSSESSYYVQLFIKGDSVPWQVILDNEEAARRPKKYIGYLARSNSEFYTINPITKVEKKGKTGMLPIGSVGYEIRDAHGISVAAVSTMDNGKVYLGKRSEDERFLMANLCTAILLQQQIGE